MDDKAAVTALLDDYYKAFSTLDVQAILPYYHEPCLLMGPGGVAALPTHAALAAFFTPAMEALRARGYQRSELSGMDVKVLSATAIQVGGTAIRYKTDGRELERVGVTYLLHKAENGWKIAVLVAHS